MTQNQRTIKHCTVCEQAADQQACFLPCDHILHRECLEVLSERLQIAHKADCPVCYSNVLLVVQEDQPTAKDSQTARKKTVDAQHSKNDVPTTKGGCCETCQRPMSKTYRYLLCPDCQCKYDMLI